MPTTDQSGEPQPTDKEYIDIIRSDIEIDKKFLDDAGIPTKIIYYCRDCEKLVKPKRIGKKFQFSCAECKGGHVAFGSEVAIRNYYKVPEQEAETKQ